MQQFDQDEMVQYIQDRQKVYEEMLSASDRNRLRKWGQGGVTDRYQLEVFSRLGVTKTQSQSRVRV